MQSILHKIEALESELKALQPLKAEYQRAFDEKIRLEFNYNSNHIEGNTLSYVETKALILKDIAPSVGTHTLRELEEMKAHDVTYALIQEYAADKEKQLTETDLKFLHHVLLVRPYYGDAIDSLGQPTKRLLEVGDYKKMPNSVRLQNGEIHHYAAPFETPAMMTELFSWYQAEETKNETHPIILAALLHYKFVKIHPFDDGNGRMARLIMNYVLLKHYFPPVVVKSTNKKNYYLTLDLADNGDTKPFINYIAEQLVWSLELNIKAAKGESVEEPEDTTKEFIVWKKNTLAKKEPALHRSTEVVRALYLEGGIKTLFENFHNAIQITFDLFHNFRRNESFNNGNISSKGTIEEIVTHANKISIWGEDGNSFQMYSGADSWYDFGVNYYLDEFLRSENHFTLHTWLKVVLEDFKYKIFFKEELLTEKTYRESLSEEEITTLVNQCAKTIFEEIKTQAAK